MSKTHPVVIVSGRRTRLTTQLHRDNSSEEMSNLGLRTQERRCHCAADAQPWSNPGRSSLFSLSPLASGLNAVPIAVTGWRWIGQPGPPGAVFAWGSPEVERSAGGADDVHALLRALAAYSHTSADFPKREGCKCLEENKDPRRPSPLSGIVLYWLCCEPDLCRHELWLSFSLMRPWNHNNLLVWKWQDLILLFVQNWEISPGPWWGRLHVVSCLERETWVWWSCFHSHHP